MDLHTGPSGALTSDIDAVSAEQRPAAAEFRQRRVDIYLRSARSHSLAAASEEHTAECLELRGQRRPAAEHRRIAANHRSKANAIVAIVTATRQPPLPQPRHCEIVLVVNFDEPDLAPLLNRRHALPRSDVEQGLDVCAARGRQVPSAMVTSATSTRMSSPFV
jgi:hypothetical protein